MTSPRNQMRSHPTKQLIEIKVEFHSSPQVRRCQCSGSGCQWLSSLRVVTPPPQAQRYVCRWRLSRGSSA
jgi:hypothetical protein